MAARRRRRGCKQLRIRLRRAQPGGKHRRVERIARNRGLGRVALIGAAALIVALIVACETPAPARQSGSLATRPRAPGFEGATAWLNVDRALTADDLRG